jgi:alcohol dehydrogenase
MNFYIPTNIFYGKNAFSEASNQLSSIGKKALIVTGKNSAKKSGALDETLKNLKSLQIDYVIYAEIEENPTLLSVNKGASICRENNCDFLVGIGGGSPIDAAKGIAIMVGSDITINEIYNPANFTKALPLVAIPITSGTGTEATQYSVLTDSENHKKAGFGTPLVFPKISLLNPEFTFSLPKNITINTTIDALSHLLEGLFSKNRYPLTYPFIFKGISLIINNLEKAVQEPNNYSYRDALMQASLYGGIVIAHSGTTLQHSIGYPLTTKFGTPHGMANGIVMKNIMKMYYPHIKQEIDDLLVYLKMSLEDFFSWLKKFDLKLNEKLDEGLIDYMTEKVMATRNMALNPVDVSREEVKELYRKIVYKIKV